MGRVRIRMGLVAVLLAGSLAVMAPAPVGADGSEAPGAPLAARSITVGDGHTCAMTAGGGIRCWGGNAFGQLGLGDTINRAGRSATNPALGTGRTAIALAAGEAHTCALLDNGTVKCWGRNSVGQLGLGDTATRGDGPGEMGDSLPAVDLGTGRTATAIAAGRRFTCAVLDDATLKCWGANDIGQLGLGDHGDRGDGPGEMGDDLPAVSLGTGRTPTAITAGWGHTCAILDNGSAKCWGYNQFGQLGVGGAYYFGGSSGDMGDNLPTVLLGTGRTATAITAAASHTCALLDDATVKCWGANNAGQLGLGDTATRKTVGELGDNLPAVSLGTGRTATAITASTDHTCARLDTGAVKCWGAGYDGSLGYGDYSSRGGAPGEMGDSLPTVDFGAGRSATAITIGGSRSCALLDNAAVKCFGGGIGNQPNEMGDHLLNAGASVNNAFADAQALTVPGSATAPAPAGTTSAISEWDDTEPGEPDHAGDPGGRSVWYRFYAQSTGTATIDTFGSDFDTVLAVYSGSSVGTLTQVAANDDTGGDQSEVSFPLVQGTTYRVAVDGAGGATGNLQLNHDVEFNPLVTIASPVDDSSHPQHEVVAADFSCAAAAGSAPVVSCVGTVADGQPITTATPGPKTFTVTATDQAGNTRVVTHDYTVIGLPTVTATVTADQNRVIAGQDIDYHVTVTNAGPAPLTSITILAPDVPDCIQSVPDLDPAESAVVDCSYTTTPDDVPMMTNQVLVLTAQGAFGLSGTRRTRVDPQVFRPDALIGLGAGAPAGNGIYNTTGTQQAKATTVTNLGTATFRIPIQNDGNVPDTYTVEGLGATNRYTVTYKDGPTTITTDVTGDDGFTIADLAPGATRQLTLVIKAKARIPLGSRIVRTVTVTSQANGSADTVKATVTRR